MINQSLGKETFIYGIGRILASSLAFLLLPFYSHSLSSISDYGLIQLITAFFAFSNIVFLFAFDASLMKHYAGEDSTNRKLYLSNTYFSLIITSSLLVSILIGFRDFFSVIIISGNNPDWIIKIAFILFFDSLRTIHLLILRAENKAYNFMLFQVIDIALLASLNIYFVGYGYENNKVAGVIHANFLSSIFIFLASFSIIFKRFDFQSLSFIAWVKIKNFAMPLVPAGIFWIVLEYSDRKMLEFLMPSDIALETVGAYGVGHKLGAIMLLMVYSFNYAWRPYFLKSKDESEFKNISSYVFYFLGFFWMLLILFVQNITTINIPFLDKPLINIDYLSGLSIVPFIALAYVFHGSFILQESGPFLKNKTQNISIIRGLGVALNLVLNYILITNYDPLLGAAIATTISYFIMSFLIYSWNKSFFNFRYNWKIIFIIITFMAGAWLISAQTHMLIKAALLVSYIATYPQIQKFSSNDFSKRT